MDGSELISKIKNELKLTQLPIVVYANNEEAANQGAQLLKKFRDTLIVKEVQSPDRLLDETSLFLHRVASKMPEAKRRMLEQANSRDSILAGRKILVVDDDIRNIFALTSVLETQDMKVIYAQNGHEAIKLLEENNDVEIVLMDVMMPEMDGYETMRRIRQMEAFQNLPIIALTAKAMKGDREKCIDAGASDYIAKPVHTEQLKSLLRVWLYQ
jgi:CheY-like chemotaxis protein